MRALRGVTEPRLQAGSPLRGEGWQGNLREAAGIELLGGRVLDESSMRLPPEDARRAGS